MKKTLHVAKANLLKNKSTTASLLIIMMLTAALLTIGLSVIMDAEKDYYDGLDRLNSLHSIISIPQDLYNPAFADFYQNDARLTEYDINEILFTGSEKVDYGGEAEISLIFFNIDATFKISAPKITDENLSIPREKAVYLPLFAKTSLGFKLGDTFTFYYRNKRYELTVGGFFEASEYNTTQQMLIRLFVPDEAFQELNNFIPSQFCFTARLVDLGEAESFNKDFVKFADIEEEDLGINQDVLAISNAIIMPVSMISALLIAFAFLLTMVMLFVIRFKVGDSINDAMQEIGVLKATGYTNKQIVKCYAAEYLLVSIPATLIGVLLSLLSFPAVRWIMQSATGFTWTLSANIPMGLIIALILTVFVLIITVVSCKKVKTYSPVVALKGSMAVSETRKNFFPLKKTSGNVHTRLGLKNIFAFRRTYLMIGVIIVISTLASVMVLGMYQAFSLDKEAFVKAAGMELIDIEIKTTRHTDAGQLAAEIENMPEVLKTVMNDELSRLYFDVDGLRTRSCVSNDFSKLEIMKAYEGSLPIYDNEIAIPVTMTKRLNKTIGDTVMITLNGQSLSYIITGLYSAVSMDNLCAITLDGVRMLNPNYERRQIGVYLNEGEEIDSFIEKLENKFGVLNVYPESKDDKYATAKKKAEEKIAFYLERYDVDSVEYAVILNDEIILSGGSFVYRIEKITNVRDFMEVTLGTFERIGSAMAMVVGFVSLVIISAVLSLTIKTMITKRRKELGILKASGYTSRQLQFQISLSFIPFAVIGVLFGGLLGQIMFSPVIGMLFSSVGIMGAAFTIHFSFVIGAALIILIVTFLASNLAARRIKNISVYELISE